MTQRIQPTHEELARWKYSFAAEAAALPASLAVSDAERARYAEWYAQAFWFQGDPSTWAGYGLGRGAKSFDHRTAAQVGRPNTPTALLFIGVLNSGLHPRGVSSVEVRTGRMAETLITTLELLPSLRAPKAVRLTDGEAYHRTGEVHLIVTPGATEYLLQLDVISDF